MDNETLAKDLHRQSHSHWGKALEGILSQKFGRHGGTVVAASLWALRLKVASAVASAIRSRRLYALDLFLCALALVIAVWLRLGPEVLSDDREKIDALVLVTVAFTAICAIAFPAAGLYKRNWKYASILDYVCLLRAILAASVALTTCLFLYSRLAFVPRSIIAIEVMALTVLLGSVRLSFRQDDLKNFMPPLRRAPRLGVDLIPILLVGAGHEADLYLRALHRDRSSNYWPVGLLGNSPEETGNILHGVPVLGTPEDFDAVVADLETRGQKPRHLIFTVRLSSFDESDMERLVQRADRMGLAVSRLNPATSLLDTRRTKDFELRPIELTDLLERPQAALDVAALQRFIQGRRVLVTGAGGSIGSELTKQVAALGPSELVVIDNCEFNLYSIDLDLSEAFPDLARSAHLCDVRDASRVNEIFARYRPELVFHAAALKHVPMVELNPCEGLLTNVCGTMNVAEAARRFRALGMVQISTDKAVNSTSFMGATKRLAELYCQALDLDGMSEPSAPRFMTVRFGNVLGSSGSLIPLFKRQLARGGPLTVTHPEMTRYFMTIREAVELTLQASAYGLEHKLGQGEIFVLDMGEPIRIIDIARRMIRLAGFTPEREIEIRIVGCRPGEKLFEELFDTAEARVAPPVPGVLGAVPTPIPLSVLYNSFEQLRLLALAGNIAGLVETIRGLLPGFREPERDAGTDGRAAQMPDLWPAVPVSGGARAAVVSPQMMSAREQPS